MPAFSDLSDAPWELLARHLAGEVSAPERAALRSWVQADPQHLQLLAIVTRAWERAGEVTAAPVLFSPADVAAAWQRFQPLMGPPPTPPAPPAAAPVPWWAARPSLAGWLPAAATLAVASLGALLLLRPPAPTPALLTYATTSQPRLVRLPDSSRVWLNAHSSLRYQGPATASGPRMVQLTGEAYFEVAPRADRPFVVSTAAAQLRGAAGSAGAFNVRAFAAEDSVDVSVAQGAVWLRRLAQADSLRLPAGHRTAVQAADAPGRVAGPLRPVVAATPNFRAWHTDTLRFQDAPVAEVVRALQVTYGTRVSYRTAALGQCRFTGTFARPRPAAVLAVLAAATTSRLLPDGQEGYLLDGPGCLSPPPARPDSAATARRP